MSPLFSSRVWTFWVRRIAAEALVLLAIAVDPRFHGKKGA